MDNEMRGIMGSLPFIMGRKRKRTQLTGFSIKSRKIHNYSEKNSIKDAFHIKETTESPPTPLKLESTVSSTYNDSKTANTISSREAQTSISESPVKLTVIHPKEYLKVAALSIRNRKRGSLKKLSQGITKQNKTSSNSRMKKVGSRKLQTKRRNTKNETKENTKKRKASKPQSCKMKRKVKGKKASKKAAANLLRKKTSPQFTLSFLNLKLDDQGRLVNANIQTKSENETDIPSLEQKIQTNYYIEDETNMMDTESTLGNSYKDMNVNMEICIENDLEQPYQELSDLPHFQNLKTDDHEQQESSTNQDVKTLTLTNETDTIPREENLPVKFWGSGESVNAMDTESSNENSQLYCSDPNINLKIYNEKHLRQYYQEPEPFELNLPSTSMERTNKVLNTKVERNWNEISEQNVKHVSESIDGTINNENLRSEGNFLNVFKETVTGLESIRNLSTYSDNMTRAMDTNTDRPFNEIKGNTIQVFESSNETISNGNSRSYIRLININQAITRSESTQNVSIYAQNTNGEVHSETDKFLNEIPAHETTDETIVSENNTNPEVIKILESISLTDQENLRKIPLFSEIIPRTQEESTRSIFTEKVQENSESFNNFPGSANIPNHGENRIVQTNMEANVETNNEISERYIQTAFSMLPLALPGLLRYVYYAFSN